MPSQRGSSTSPAAALLFRVTTYASLAGMLEVRCYPAVEGQ
ncbi:hypothetical protein [Ilumatobacter nonamiensis]|nr:hypothetical protein [Ilumatobacter nonamiensis]